MQKTMGDMAKFLKQLIPMSIPEKYSIKPMFREISVEEDIRNGVSAFRDFMYRLCDCLISDEELSNIVRKGKKKNADEISLSVEFPFLNNIRSIFINIGYYGILSEQGDSLTIVDWDRFRRQKSLSKNSRTKISNTQMFKAMRFLNKLGIEFDGIDLNVKKPDISEIKTIKMSYPDSPNMLTAIKTLAIAENELANRSNDYILMRCDYKVLKDEENEDELVLEEFNFPLSQSLQNFVCNFHKHAIDAGMQCKIELRQLCINFIYSYKRKDILRFSSSLINDYRVVFKTKNTDNYPDVIEGFPEFLQERIAKGYGCDRKAGSGHGSCLKGCEGFSFSLNESIIDIAEDLKIWLDSELSSMQKKRKSRI